MISYPSIIFQQVPVPSFTDEEYNQHLQAQGWTKEETNHLIDLAKRFDLRFIVMQDRWDKEKFADRTVEDLKERYYTIKTVLDKVRAQFYSYHNTLLKSNQNQNL